MIKTFTILSVLMLSVSALRAQQPVRDSALLVRLPEIEVTANRIWENDTVRYRYNQTKYYVQTVLPYLQAATSAFQDVNSQIQSGALRRRDRRQLVQQQEALLRSRFEDKLRDLNTTQGVLLVKLIARQTGLNLYQIISELKGGFAAMKWQGWARINGLNLNRKYDPNDEPVLEHIMRGLGYPLPASYAREE